MEPAVQTTKPIQISPTIYPRQHLIPSAGPPNSCATAALPPPHLFNMSSLPTIPASFPPLLFLVVLLLLALPASPFSTPSGLALSFHSRLSDYHPGEVRTTPFSTLESISSGFSYSVLIRLPQTIQSDAQTMGDLYAKGHVLSLNVGSPSSQQTLAFATMYDNLSFGAMDGVVDTGPHARHFLGPGVWHQVAFSLDLSEGVAISVYDSVVGNTTHELDLAAFLSDANSVPDTPVSLRLGMDPSYVHIATPLLSPSPF